jgi:tRNA/tmRNA/rRNA uracil-C5-methylase (TrmA/RlmC/RlmD family)
MSMNILERFCRPWSRRLTATCATIWARPVEWCSGDCSRLPARQNLLNSFNRNRQRPRSLSTLAHQGKQSIVATRDLSAHSHSGHEDEEYEDHIEAPGDFVPFPFHYHELIADVVIESINSKGVGIGRVSLPRNRRDWDEGEIRQKMSLVRKKKNSHKSSKAVKRRAKQHVKLYELMLTHFGLANTSLSPSQDASESTWEVHVPYVIPGEIVTVQIVENFLTHSEGTVAQLVKAHPQRVAPACPYFTVCRGCQLQHMPLSLQRHFKTQWISELFIQHGFSLDSGTERGLDKSLADDTASMIIPPVSPTLGADDEFGYKSMLTPSYVTKRKSRLIGDSQIESEVIQVLKVGLKHYGVLADVGSCRLVTPAIDNAYQQVRADLLRQELPVDESNWNKNKAVQELFFRQSDNVASQVSDSAKFEVVMRPTRPCFSTVGGMTFQHLANVYLRDNLHVLELMMDQVKIAMLGASNGSMEFADDVAKMTHVIDCFCGVGVFALALADVVSEVVGVNKNARAIGDARANAEAAGKSKNCDFIRAPATTIFQDPHVKDFPRETTAVLVDPPIDKGTGCDVELLAELIRYSPQRIVYVATDPLSQARDCSVLCLSGPYFVSKIQPFDVAPQTKHVQNLVVLEKRV